MRMIWSSSVNTNEKDPAPSWQRCWPQCCRLQRQQNSEVFASDVVLWLWRLVCSPHRCQETFPPNWKLQQLLPKVCLCSALTCGKSLKRDISSLLITTGWLTGGLASLFQRIHQVSSLSELSLVWTCSKKQKAHALFLILTDHWNSHKIS